MRAKRKVIGIAWVAAALLLAGLVAFFLPRTKAPAPAKLGIRIAWFGQTRAGESILTLDLTNQAHVPVTLHGVEIEWTDPSGRIIRSHVTPSFWRATGYKLGPGEVMSTSFSFPRGAERIRARLCKDGGPLGKLVRGIIGKVPLPGWFLRLLEHSVLDQHGDCLPYRWIGNPNLI